MQMATFLHSIARLNRSEHENVEEMQQEEDKNEAHKLKITFGTLNNWTRQGFTTCPCARTVLEKSEACLW